MLGSTGVVNPAHLTAGALQAITNGDFTTTASWNREGATNIINGTATLTEQSQKLSQLTQAFTIPTGAKRLQGGFVGMLGFALLYPTYRSIY